MNYRAEIDGLRAIAVLSVLIFHFFPTTLNLGFNGFLGVDIFFVISGFLISKYIYRGLETNSFSFKQFYWRRIKRILPAALFTLILTSCVGIFLLTPYDLDSYFKSLLAALVFIPNIYFWRTGGYFGDLDSLKPLLHYWSLGIEEQFYLFFPITLFIIYKLIGKKHLLTLIIILALWSLILNIYLLNISGANPAFFLLPARVWEFCIGSIAAYLSNKIKIETSPFLTNFLIFFLIFFLFIDTKNYVPLGFFTCIFTGLFLFFNHSNNSFSRVLSSRVFTFIGKISFSLYLIHWPVIVFLDYFYVDEVPIEYVLLSIIIVLFFSYISYKLIEVPFRHNFSNRAITISLFLMSSLLLATSISGLNTNVFKKNNSILVSNLSNQVQSNYRCPVTTYRSFGGSRACILGSEFSPSTIETVIIGNSHAQMYVPAIGENIDKTNALLIPLNRCLPTVNINVLPSCFSLANQNFQSLQKLPSLNKVIYAMTWHKPLFFKDGKTAAKKDLLDDLIQSINKLESQNIQVYVVSPIPIPGYNHASEFSRKLKFNTITEEDYLLASMVNYKDFKEEIEIFDQGLSEKLGENYIKVYEALCDNSHCFHGDLNGSYFSDSNHISAYGLRFTKESFKILN